MIIQYKLFQFSVLLNVCIILTLFELNPPPRSRTDKAKQKGFLRFQITAISLKTTAAVVFFLKRFYSAMSRLAFLTFD